FVPSLPATNEVKAADCSIEVESTIDGSLENLKVVLAGRGQGVRLDANATLLPRAAFPFKQAVLGLDLADGSSLDANVDWDSKMVGDVIHDHLAGFVRSKKLNLGQLAGSAIPSALITTSMNFDVQLLNRRALSSANLDIEFSPDSRWNKQPLSGVLKAKITDSAGGVAAPQADSWKTLQLTDVTMDLRLGKNHLGADGALGDAGSRLNLNVLAPQLAAFWPDIAGGIKLQGRVGGSPAAHTADLTATYTPANSQPNDFATAPIELALRASGAWGGPVSGQTTDGVAPGWHGVLSQFRIRRSGLSATLGKSLALEFLPGAVAPAWQWQMGAATIKVSLPSQTEFVIRHKGSRGGPGRWETQGAIDRLALSSDVVSVLWAELGFGARGEDSDGAKAARKKNHGTGEIVFDSNWDLKFAGALEGQVHIKRSSGDLRVPGDPSFMLGLQTLGVDVVARRAGASTSKVTADMNVVTAKMGRVAASGSALLHVSSGGAFSFNKKDPKEVTVQADVADLGWASLFLGDATDLGGSLKASLKAQSQPDGAWAASGTVAGQKIRLVRLDDGVRLLDGTLAAHLEGNRFVLDSLRFPAQQRVTPKEWRTNEWLTTSPQAKGGSLALSGAWNLFESTGAINVDLVRYPILQRADRYAMVTGKLTVNAPLPKIAIAGSVTADAGWFDLDVLGGVPTVDNDVVVIRPGQVKKTEVPADISLDLTVDLGSRFYLTGYGVNSGLLGSLRILTVDGRLTGEGELRTRGGSIDVYGQHLQLRRGTVTFQGDIANPILNIEALRTGVSVQAGVRVAGTAKRPRIGLVSYPDVSDVEKLSWLL
ncbi:MAG: translocation/assembly module TamB domain-containing protein, partial [Burkholderiaceae bacterium]